jgi:predicted transcriptional regulator
MLRLCLGFTATSYLNMLVRIGYLVEHDGVYELTDNADKFIEETLAYMSEYIKETQEVKK